ncbi:MAG: GNAT superfamily N-acetyltransferase [Candidatus Pseudothioglobus sp.]|jgi:GNAT superfamily N-acetyltransferase
MKTHIDIWHIELKDPGRVPVAGADRPYRLEQITQPNPTFNRYLYISVGSPWQWYMRLPWRYSQWLEAVSRPELQTWVAYYEGVPAGYFELEQQAHGSVEIGYFGLVPEFIGRGFGKALLEDAISRAWQLGGQRVWLHTCSLDHPNALSNYLARGFSVFKQEHIVEDLPNAPLQPWAGAAKTEMPLGLLHE